MSHQVLSRRHRRVKGAWRSPRTRPCPLQFSAELLQHELEGMFLWSHPFFTPFQVQGTGPEMLLELLEMKLDPKSSREQELSSHGQEQGWDGIWRAPGERRGSCIGFNRAKTLCKLMVQKTGLAIAGVEQEQGNPVATACSR